MSLNFRYICRLCLKQNGSLMRIFSEENEESVPTIPAKIKSFAPTLQLCAGDGLPDQICQQCACQVDTTYKFKLQCESSDATLRQLYNDAFTDSSTDSWTNLEIEASSNKVVMKKTPKNKQCSSPRRIIVKNCKKYQQNFTRKVNGKKCNKVDKRYSSSAAEAITKSGNEEPAYALEKESGSVDCVKADDNDSVNNDFSVKVQMRVKKPYMKLFHCHDCGKNFAKKTQLILHMSAHTGAKPYICSQCGRTFASRINLKKHLFTHTGEKPYLCTRCGISFGRIDTLTKHMRSHTGEKPFHCSVCGNNFARRSTFTNHMRTHSGEKPYLCTECGWRCVQSYDLKKHMRCHTGEKPFRCTVCRISFGQRNSLTKHMRCHIGEVPLTMDCAKEMQYQCQ
ncbi:hypothetical protein Cfor_07380, partial [Coptotermes formosanus]